MDPTAFLGDGLVQKQREEELQEAKWRVKGEQKERERQAPEDKKLSNLKVPEDKKLSNLEALGPVGDRVPSNGPPPRMKAAGPGELYGPRIPPPPPALGPVGDRVPSNGPPPRMKAAGPGELYGPRIPPPPPALGPGEVHGPCNPPQALNYLNLNKKYEVTNKVVPMGRPHTPFLSWHEESLASVKTLLTKVSHSDRWADAPVQDDKNSTIHSIQTEGQGFTTEELARIREQFGLNKPKKQSFTPKEDEALHRKRSWKEGKEDFESDSLEGHKDKLSRVGDAVQTVGKDHQDEAACSESDTTEDSLAEEVGVIDEAAAVRFEEWLQGKRDRVEEKDYMHFNRKAYRDLVVDPGWKVTTKPHDECGFPDPGKTDWNHPEKVSEHYYWCMGGLPGMERGLLLKPSMDPPQDPPPKTPPIALGSALKDRHRPFKPRSPSRSPARPPARSPARSPSRTPSQKVRQRGGRRLQTARRRSRTRTPPSRRVPERSNPALEQFLIDREINEKATQVLRQAAPEVQEQLLRTIRLDHAYNPSGVALTKLRELELPRGRPTPPEPRDAWTRATGDERPEAPRRRDGRRADAFSARRILLERILGEPDFAHYQREGRHELVPVRQIKQVQEDPRAGTPVLIRWDFNNYTLVYGSLSQAEGGNVRASVYDWDTVPAPLACKMALDSQDLRDALRPFLHGKRHALYDPAENREAWKDYSSKRALVEVQYIRHSHNEVNRYFAHGEHANSSVLDLIEDLINEKAHPQDLTPFVVIQFTKLEYWAVFGNRRLKALKEFQKYLDDRRDPLQVKARCLVWKKEEVPAVLACKLAMSTTTTNLGKFADWADKKGKGKGKGRR
ncbi:unnamed protein product [Durusdinium trenchii]|uniref:Uncharacterized protein n=2 Tax=Durusdinium trenchii TaxID=1381693 RepID=A0ABP0JVJ3_9DINO